MADAQGRAAGPVPQVDIRMRPGGRQRVRADARRRPPRAATTLVTGTKVGEVYRDRRLRRRRLGRRRRSATTSRSIREPADRDARRRTQVRLGDVAEIAVCQPPTRSSAKGPRGGSTSTATSRNATSAPSPAKSSRSRGLSSSPPSTTPSSWRVRRAPGSRRRYRLLALSLIGVAPDLPLRLQAAFRSWRLAIVALLTLPFALIGGVFAALHRAAACCRSGRWSASSPCWASPPATASCWSATTASGAGRGRCRSARTWCSAAPRSGCHRS